MEVNFITFGLKFCHTQLLDVQIDARPLPNPYYVPELTHKNGLDKDVFDFVMDNDFALNYLKKIKDYLDFYLSNCHGNKCNIGICCTGGQHRSVALGVKLYELYKDKFNVKLIHEEMENWD